jgi:hypothetical protein
MFRKLPRPALLARCGLALAAQMGGRRSFTTSKSVELIR